MQKKGAKHNLTCINPYVLLRFLGWWKNNTSKTAALAGRDHVLLFPL